MQQVCGSDGGVYFNACFAGCTTRSTASNDNLKDLRECEAGCEGGEEVEEENGEKEERGREEGREGENAAHSVSLPLSPCVELSGCGCMPPTLPQTASWGKCSGDCKSLPLFLVLLFLAMFVAFLISSPVSTVILK